MARFTPDLLLKCQFLVLVTLLSIACGSDTNTPESNVFVVGINKDPDRLNPVFNGSSLAREIYQNMYLPLAEFDPNSLQLIPVLIEQLPIGQAQGNDTISYTFRIVDDAKWSDGKPITGYDYDFAFKAVKLPTTQTAAWKPYLDFVYSISVDSSDSRVLTAVCDRTSMLSLETVMTFYPLPEHIYDTTQILRKYNHELFNDPQTLAQVAEQDSALIAFAEAFNQPSNYRDPKPVAGPYTLDKWESDQYVSLVKVADYWGNMYPNNPYLQTNADTLLFKIIKDETALSTLLKDGGLDLTKYCSVTDFADMQTTPPYDEQFTYATPELAKIAYIAVNNRKPALSDKAVRKALAHCIDVQSLIDTEQNGLADRVSVLVNPQKSYYPKQLKPLDFDLEIASSLLAENGWADSDNNGVLDKMLNGKQEELSFDLLITGNALTKTLALLLQESGKKVGIDIKIVQKAASAFLKENVNTHDFDMVALLASYDESDEDPYRNWHSDNTGVNEKNITGFSSSKTDSLITLIRNAESSDFRNPLYKELYAILYAETPLIPLFAPKERIVVSAKYSGVIGPKRPGYLANTFKQPN